MSRRIGTALGVARYTDLYDVAHNGFQHAWWALVGAAAVGVATALGVSPAAGRDVAHPGVRMRSAAGY